MEHKNPCFIQNLKLIECSQLTNKIISNIESKLYLTWHDKFLSLHINRNEWINFWLQFEFNDHTGVLYFPKKFIHRFRKETFTNFTFTFSLSKLKPIWSHLFQNLVYSLKFLIVSLYSYVKQIISVYFHQIIKLYIR